MSITIAIVIITVLISIWAWRDPSLMDRWVMNPYKVTHQGQYYRLVTSGFLHADFGHLFFNMFSFWIFGGLIERIFLGLFGPGGAIALFVFYVIGIIVSDLPTLIKHRNNSRYNSLGASGGVSSIIFAAILFFPLQDICLYGIFCMPGFIFGILYLIYSYYESRRGAGFINHEGQFYGALFGVVCMIIVYPPVVPSFVEQIAGWRLF